MSTWWRRNTTKKTQRKRLSPQILTTKLSLPRITMKSNQLSKLQLSKQSNLIKMIQFARLLIASSIIQTANQAILTVQIHSLERQAMTASLETQAASIDLIRQSARDQTALTGSTQTPKN